MNKTTKKIVLDKALEQEMKYCDLVAYARKRSEDIESIPRLKEWVDNMIEKYPNECYNLSAENGDWHHGFNSGCLAAFRYITTMMTVGLEDANESFPELDT